MRIGESLQYWERPERRGLRGSSGKAMSDYATIREVSLGISHLRELIGEHERRDELRHKGEHDALAIAALNIDHRLGVMNEFREQLTLERGMYVTRELHDKLQAEADKRLKILEGTKSNLEGRMWVLGAVVIILNVLFVFLRRG